MAYIMFPNLDWYSTLFIALSTFGGHGESRAASIGVEIPSHSPIPKRSKTFIMYLVWFREIVRVLRSYSICIPRYCLASLRSTIEYFIEKDFFKFVRACRERPKVRILST